MLARLTAAENTPEKKKPERAMARYSPGRPAPGSEGKPEISIGTILPAWMADVKSWLPADQLLSQWSQDIKKKLRRFAIDAPEILAVASVSSVCVMCGVNIINDKHNYRWGYTRIDK